MAKAEPKKTRTLNRLSSRFIETAKPGLHADGGGLYLHVAGKTKRWVFIYQSPELRTAKGQPARGEVALGLLRDVDVIAARDARDANRKLVVAGIDPMLKRKRDKEAAELEAKAKAEAADFAMYAATVAPLIGPTAPKARKAWLHMLQVKVGALAQLAPADVTTADVRAALEPYQSKAETARRMRQRIERVLDAARADDLIKGAWENPARLRGHLEFKGMAKRPKVEHHKALPFKAMPDFMAQLAQLDRMSAYALRFTILTALRNGAVRLARWGEIDFASKLWNIPAAHMKGVAGHKRAHTVPLSEQALAVLAKVKPETVETDALIFPYSGRAYRGSGAPRPLSENAMAKVLDSLGLKGTATVHGFRSSFRDWAGDSTAFPREVIEAAMAHVVGDEAERAYRRSDALAKRAKLMDAWGAYCARRTALKRAA